MSSSEQNNVLQISQKDHIVLIRLNRPEARNALSEELLDRLSSTLDQIGSNQDIRAVIIAGSGSAFSAGHDLKEMSAHRADKDRGRAYFTSLIGRCSLMMQKITHLPQPVIAAVDGIATAAGCQLVATCDLAIAGRSSRFCTPGVHIGLFCSTPMVALSRNISPKHAMEMLMLGEMVSAEEALRFGFVNRVVSDGQAEEEAWKMALTIAEKSPVAVKIGKRAFYEQIELPRSSAYLHVMQVMVENMLARDAEEGIGAFLEKRKPEWHVQ